MSESESLETRFPPEADGGRLRVSSPSDKGEGQRRRRRNWAHAADELSGVPEGDMSTKNAQRKHGTTRGSPRRSRTAKTSRISRCAAKSRCACKWGRWGRLSDDGPGHYNPDRSEDPWGRGGRVSLERRRSTPRHRPAIMSGEPATTTESAKGEGKPPDVTGYAGSRLNPEVGWKGLV